MSNYDKIIIYILSNCKVYLYPICICNNKFSKYELLFSNINVLLTYFILYIISLY